MMRCDTCVIAESRCKRRKHSQNKAEDRVYEKPTVYKAHMARLEIDEVCSECVRKQKLR